MARFIQSEKDFPLMVTLGKKQPLWTLSRWRGDDGLCFVPQDNEGFDLRGDKRQLLYKGSKRSHRFTIHSDKSFEYDCILNKEPAANVVTLLMAGAEAYDFFRQPDYVKDPFLKGSYAVYKKTTMIGEGTGKLCHIHRPLITDARGRKTWGVVSVDDNKLHIIIPEKWLGEAAYPVVVDPVIGTATEGKFTHYIDENGCEDAAYLFCSIGANRFYVPQDINGYCTAYAYSYEYMWDPCDATGIIYSDHLGKPQKLMSDYEETFLLDSPDTDRGWQHGDFFVTNKVSAGSYIWFGIWAQGYWNLLFDYGTTCRYTNEISTWKTPSTFPEPHNIIDRRLSMYFTYPTPHNYERYISDYRNMVFPVASSKSSLAIFRKTTQTINVKSTIRRILYIIRKCKANVKSFMNIKRLQNFSRLIIESIKGFMISNSSRKITRKNNDEITPASKIGLIAHYINTVKQIIMISENHSMLNSFARNIKIKLNTNQVLNRAIFFNRYLKMLTNIKANTLRIANIFGQIRDSIKTKTGNYANLSFIRIFGEIIKPITALQRFPGFFRLIGEIVSFYEQQYMSTIFIRAIDDNLSTLQTFRYIAAYIRKMMVMLNGQSVMKSETDYYRLNQELVKGVGSISRGILFFVRIVTGVIIRDYFLRRFLKAREELKLKSCVCREIMLNSKI